MDLLEELFASGNVQKAWIQRYLQTFPIDLPLDGIRIVSFGLRQDLGTHALEIRHKNVKDYKDK